MAFAPVLYETMRFGPTPVVSAAICLSARKSARRRVATPAPANGERAHIARAHLPPILRILSLFDVEKASLLIDYMPERDSDAHAAQIATEFHA